jgi:hypothetical protein
MEALGHVVKPCDPNSLTITEMTQKYDMGRQAAQIRLNDLIKQGKALPTWKMVGGRRIRSYRLTTK